LFPLAIQTFIQLPVVAVIGSVVDAVVVTVLSKTRNTSTQTVVGYWTTERL